MQHYKIYEQTDFEEIIDLINSQPTCILETLSETNEIQTGIFNPVYSDGRVILHLHRQDQQVRTMRGSQKARLIFQDILAIFPSYWADERYAGAATTYYRYAELNCSVRLIESPQDQVPYQKMFMKRYQPEGRYDEITADSDVYKKALETILIAELKIEGFKGKWKLGQNRPVEKRLEFIKKFKERAQGNDLRCATEIERWLARHELRHELRHER